MQHPIASCLASYFNTANKKEGWSRAERQVPSSWISGPGIGLHTSSCYRKISFRRPKKPLERFRGSTAGGGSGAMGILRTAGRGGEFEFSAETSGALSIDPGAVGAAGSHPAT